MGLEGDEELVKCEELELVRSLGLCTLFIHALLYGIFIVGFGGVLEGAAEACCCHVTLRSSCSVV